MATGAAQFPVLSIAVVVCNGPQIVMFKYNNCYSCYSPFAMLQLNADVYESDPELEQIRKDQGYSYMDIITIHKDTLPNYEEKVI